MVWSLPLVPLQRSFCMSIIPSQLHHVDFPGAECCCSKALLRPWWVALSCRELSANCMLLSSFTPPSLFSCNLSSLFFLCRIWWYLGTVRFKPGPQQSCLTLESWEKMWLSYFTQTEQLVVENTGKKSFLFPVLPSSLWALLLTHTFPSAFSALFHRINEATHSLGFISLEEKAEQLAEPNPALCSFVTSMANGGKGILQPKLCSLLHRCLSWHLSFEMENVAAVCIQYLEA